MGSSGPTRAKADSVDIAPPNLNAEFAHSRFMSPSTLATVQEDSREPEAFVVAHPNAAMEEFAALMEPEDFVEPETATPMFPRHAHEGTCRICGRVDAMTEEHLPPRGAFNRGRGRSPELVDALGREELDPPETGSVFQGGVSGFMLCGECNNLTGTRWAREYQGWARRAAAALAGIPGGIASADETVGFPAWDELIFKSVYPGRYVRHVLTMMLCLSGDETLGERFPVLRRLILGGEPEPLPDPLRLYFSVVAGPVGRLVGGPRGQLWIDLETRSRRRILAADFPPLAQVLVVDGPEAPDLGVEITDLTTYELDRRTNVKFEDLPLGFTYKPWPTDYRNRATILADRG
jgi:hypothetical protein